MKGLTSKELGKRIVQYCVGLTFVAGASALVVYATHGWAWYSKFAGGRITLTLPEFLVIIVLVTLPVGICIEMWRSRNRTKRQLT
jgi:hypothetical protein